MIMTILSEELNNVSEELNKEENEKEIDIFRSVEMRYLGQIHECTVNIDTFDIDNTTIEKKNPKPNNKPWNTSIEHFKLNEYLLLIYKKQKPTKKLSKTNS